METTFLLRAGIAVARHWDLPTQGLSVPEAPDPCVTFSVTARPEFGMDAPDPPEQIVMEVFQGTRTLLGYGPRTETLVYHAYDEDQTSMGRVANGA